jgi:hypothetical protein
MTTESTPRVCSICGDNYDGFGNNAYPVNDGRCCNVCNATQVVPIRIAEYYGRRLAEKMKQENG